MCSSTGKLEPDFPTAEAPHRVIGVLGVVSERGARARSVARLVEAAAQHGAQLLYVTTPKYVDGAVMAVAIHLSDAADDQPTVDALLAQPMADLEGYAPTEQRLELSLDGPRSEVRFLTQPNHCYAARLVLEQTASLSSSSYDFLSLSGVSPEDANAIQAAFTGDPPGWNGRSWNLATKVSPRERQFTTRLGCTLDGGPVEAFFQAPAKAGPLGAGRARLVIYAKPERREVLEQKQAEARRRFEEDRAKSRANARSKCRRPCGVLRVICDRDRSSCAEYRSCLSRNYLRDADCR